MLRQKLVRSTGLAVVGLSLAGVGAFAQSGPIVLGNAEPKPAAASVPQKPIGQAAAPAAPKSTQPVTAPKRAQPGAAAPPAPKPVAQTAKPTAAAKPIAAGGDPKATKAAAAAQKISPEARRAALHAAKTGQPVPPVHEHVSKPYTGSCANPDALGTSRVLEIDTTDGLYLGRLYSGRLPLGPKEIVLTFDDGPAPHNTDKVLAALDKECVKATYFIVGQMAKAYPDILRRVAAAGHTVAYHTMSHPLDMVKRPLGWAQENISSGWSSVDAILYGKADPESPAVPFFRYPGLFNSRQINEWLNGKNVGVFAADATGNDWVRGYDAQKVMEFSLKDLERAGNSGILLLHDTKDSTATMMPALLRELKARGYKIVHLVPKIPTPPLATGPVAAELPSNAPAPIAERNVSGFDTGRQINQTVQGRTGTTSAAPLPAYDSTGIVRVTASVPAKAATAPAAQGTTSAAFGGPGIGGQGGSAVLPGAGGGSSIGQNPAGGVSTNQASNGSPRATQVSDGGWFSSTANAVRGIGSAIGLW